MVRNKKLNNLTWQQVFTDLQNRPVNKPFFNKHITNTEFVAKLSLLKLYFSDDYLSGKGEMSYVRDWLSQLLLDDRFGEVCIRDLYYLAENIEKIQAIKGSKKLLRQLPSQNGYFTQLKISCWLVSALKVVELEAKRNGLDVDVVVLMDGEEILFDVKDLHQSKKQSIQFINHSRIYYAIKKKNVKNNVGKQLLLKDSNGFVSQEFSEVFWEEKVKSICVPGSYLIKLRNNEKIELSLVWESDSNTGKVMGFNMLYPLNSHIRELSKKIKDPSSQKLYIIGASLQIEGFDLNQKVFDNFYLAGFVLVRMGNTNAGMHYQRSKFISNSRCASITKLLEAHVPVSIEL